MKCKFLIVFFLLQWKQRRPSVKDYIGEEYIRTWRTPLFITKDLRKVYWEASVRSHDERKQIIEIRDALMSEGQLLCTIGFMQKAEHVTSMRIKANFLLRPYHLVSFLARIWNWIVWLLRINILPLKALFNWLIDLLFGVQRHKATTATRDAAG